MKFIFPKPEEIEYISLAYNGVTYFSPALHATTDIFFSVGYFFLKSPTLESLDSLPRRRSMGDTAGMLDECDESLNTPLTSAWEARAWAACGFLCRPIFDCRWATNQNSFLLKK